MQQVAYVRPVEYKEGRSDGMSGWFVKNGKLCFQVLADKCLGIAEFSLRKR